MEKLRYKKIRDFIDELNDREKKYILKKIKKEIFQNEVLTTNFTINGKPLQTIWQIIKKYIL